MAAYQSWEAAEVDAALDAAIETGPGRLDFDDDALAPGAADELEAGLDIDADVDADPDDSTLDVEPVTSDQQDNIRVFVRVRPPNAREGSAPCRDIVRVDVAQRAVHLMAEPARSFAFDGVLSESAAQEEVFKLVDGAAVGEACLSGYNGSIYVYGQTGSGKTYTMQGPVASVQAMHSNERRGIMCRILDMIFAEVGRRHREGGSVEYKCKCSYLEIYREQITDLLEPGSTNLQVREDINRGIYVERLSEHTVWTVSDAFHVLWKGLHQRHVSATHMNELSSRSHAVFTLVLEAISTTPGGVTSTRSARLNLIDLAGSERQNFDPHNPTLHESLRVKEAGAINRSLSALTNVIMSLSRAGKGRRNSNAGTGAQRRPFVRYRDSKLTFLLRDSLGGNSKTVIVANVSPSALCFGETLSTLKFAARAKHIRCAAVMNEEYSGTVENLMLEVKSLKQQLALLSSRGLIPGDAGTESQASFADASSSSVILAAGDADQEEDPLEALIQCGNDDLRRLYGPRRVRRLEILLAAALERERRCELRRHKLDKFTQYLDGLLEHKERYFDGLRDYYAFLVDSVAAETAYPPELMQNLVAFRRQLSRVPTESRGFEPDAEPVIVEEPEGLDESQSQQQLTSDSPWTRSQSFGLLAGRRRGTSQSMQQKSPSGRLKRGASQSDSPYSPAASSPLVTSPGSGAWFSGDPEEEQVILLRNENKLLRRQLESHPELHRLAVENRLLREHLASLVQQHALAREEPPWPKGHRHARRAHDGLNKDNKRAGTANQAEHGNESMLREPSLTRTSKSSFFGLAGETSTNEASHSLMKTTLAQALKKDDATGTQKQSSVEETPSKVLTLGPFPGIEDATQISPSDSSVDSDGQDSDIGSEAIPSAVANTEVIPGSIGSRGVIGPTGLASAAPPRPGGDLGSVPGTADASSFLPTMAREVEELLHVKGGLEDALKQFIRASRANEEAADISAQAGTQPNRVRSSASLAALANTEVEPRMASEILRGTSEALRFAQGMLAKGKGEPLLLSAIGGQEGEGSESAGTSLRGANEGLDERDVFLSLMRSLPSEGPSLSRHGFAMSAPDLSPVRTISSSAGNRAASSHAAITVPTLRLSSSTGSAATRLMRNRSTLQLHRIAEQPASPLPGQSGENPWEARTESATEDVIDEGDTGIPEYSSEMLKEAAQKVKSLCNNLELINDAYRDMREQYKPLQQEYDRKLDECRFLEAQCRRLDVHCRLLEERAPASEGGSPSRPQLLTSTASSGSMLARFQRFQGHAGGVGPGARSGKGSILRALSNSSSSYGTLSPDGSQEVLHSPGKNAAAGAGAGASASSALGAVASSSTAAGARPWAWGVAPSGPVSSGSAVAAGGTATKRANSANSLGLGALTSAAAGKAEVPPRGLLYAASVSELCLDSQRHQGSTKVLGTAGPSCTEDYIRRVASAPQLPSAQTAGATAPSAGVGPAVAVAPARPIQGGVGASAEDELPMSASTAAASGGSSSGAQKGYDESTFLSLAAEPGDKTAALQYLMSSTRNALGTIGESHEHASATARSPSAGTSGTSPARSASVGSLGGVANVVGVGALGAGAAGVGSGPLVAPSLLQGLPHEGFSSASMPGHRHAVPSSVHGGAANAPRVPYRGPLGTSGSGTSLRSGDVNRDRFEMLSGPSIAAGGVPMSSVHQAAQSQSQPRSVASAQQPVGMSVRPATSGLPAGSSSLMGQASSAARRQLSGSGSGSQLNSSQLGGPSHRLG